MEELIAKFLPEELKERRRLYEEEMEELSKYVYARFSFFFFRFHSQKLIELNVPIFSSLLTW